MGEAARPKDLPLSLNITISIDFSVDFNIDIKKRRPAPLPSKPIRKPSLHLKIVNPKNHGPKRKAASPTRVNSLHGEAVKLTKFAQESETVVHIRYYPEVRCSSRANE
ncbi:hypothetical protein [Desulfosporosinus acididurans]|uniref:hypothetical protein n=1 Tax=Desulfosporosinus acididurans TaxID=476652 RepID=UPI0013792EF4|nr:hypothetical protein [Desulfosporosinus acididurans]